MYILILLRQDLNHCHKDLDLSEIQMYHFNSKALTAIKNAHIAVFKDLITNYQKIIKSTLPTISIEVLEKLSKLDK